MFISWSSVALLACALPLAIITARPETVWAWLVLVLLAVALDVALTTSPRKLAARRSLDGSVRRLEQTTSTVFVINPTRRHVRGLVRDAWQPSAEATGERHELDLPPGEMRRFRTMLAPSRRGDIHAGPVVVRVNGPLRLAGRQLSIPVPATLRVLPEFASRRHLPSRLARLRELDGRSAVRVRGAGSEFDSLREYVIGDDVRSIDWRASARRSDVVVRTWRPERDRRVLILVDTSRHAAARVGDQPRIDTSIEATLLLAALASKAGDRVEVIAFDRTVRTRVKGLSGPAMMAALANQLAPLEPRLIEADWTAAASIVDQALGQRALVAVLTSIDPAAIESGMLRALRPLARKHQVVVASVDDPDVLGMMSLRGNVLDVYGAAAATRFDLERKGVSERLRKGAIDVVSGGPEEIAPRLADRYLELKAAGRL
jgi:uncharacterized protein (DUF58 family)